MIHSESFTFSYWRLVAGIGTWPFQFRPRGSCVCHRESTRAPCSRPNAKPQVQRCPLLVALAQHSLLGPSQSRAGTARVLCSSSSSSCDYSIGLPPVSATVPLSGSVVEPLLQSTQNEQNCVIKFWETSKRPLTVVKYLSSRIE